MCKGDKAMSVNRDTLIKRLFIFPNCGRTLKKLLEFYSLETTESLNIKAKSCLNKHDNKKEFVKCLKRKLTRNPYPKNSC
ncbi:MAG: hypothetical protein ACI83B_003330 [Sediminicola sp.]|jgi:hypothetical protein